MATNPFILDAQALKRLPVPNTAISPMPSGPLPVPSAMTSPNVSLAPMTSPPPNLAASPMPSVMKEPDPAIQNTRLQVLGHQRELQRLNDTGSGISQIKNPFLRGLARVGDVAESIIVPGAAAFTPGTELNHQRLVNQQEGYVNKALGNQQEQAQTEGINLQNDAQPIRNALTQAQTDLTGAQAARAKIPIAPTIKYSVGGLPESVNDGYGHTYLPTDQNMPPQIKQMFDVAKANYQTNADKTLKPLTQEGADSRNAIWNPILAKHHLPLNQFTPGMSSSDSAQLASAFNSVISRGQGDQHISISLTGLQDRHDRQNANSTIDTSDPAMQASIAAVAHGDMKLQDVFGRGATTALKAQFVAAVKQVNPNYNSGDHDIENAVRRYMTSGQGGSTLTAGNTLTHHLDLYDKAVDALHNGDMRTLNAIGNELGLQMGNDAQTNMGLIRTGVAAEAARFWTGAAPSDSEIKQFAGDLSGDGSPAQMHGGANMVRGMAKGKMQGLEGQFNAGQQGQPNFGNSAPPQSGGTAVSLRAAMALPQNKGKTETEVRNDIQSHGHTVKP